MDTVPHSLPLLLDTFSLGASTVPPPPQSYSRVDANALLTDLSTVIDANVSAASDGDGSTACPNPAACWLSSCDRPASAAWHPAELERLDSRTILLLPRHGRMYVTASLYCLVIEHFIPMSHLRFIARQSCSMQLCMSHTATLYIFIFIHLETVENRKT